MARINFTSVRDRLRVLGIGRWELVLINVLVILAIAVVIYRLFFRAPTPQTFPIINSPEQNSGAVTVTFTGDKTITRQRAPIVELTSFVAARELLPYVSNRFGLPISSFSQNAYISADTQESIYGAYGNQGLEYHNFNNNPTPGEIIAVRQAQDEAMQFIEIVGAQPNQMQLQEDKTIFLNPAVTGEENPDPVDESQATLVELHYNRIYDDIPVTNEASSIEDLSITISQKGVSSAIIPPILFTTGTAQQYQLITADQALDQIRNGNYVITSSIINRVQKGTTLESLALDSIMLQYRIIEAENRMVPVYRFSGSVMLSNGAEESIVVITPAYSTDVLDATPNAENSSILGE